MDIDSFDPLRKALQGVADELLALPPAVQALVEITAKLGTETITISAATLPTPQRADEYAEAIEELVQRAVAPDELVEAYRAAIRAHQQGKHPSWPRIHRAIDGRWSKAERLRIADAAWGGVARRRKGRA